jgi:hypothetical protein
VLQQLSLLGTADSVYYVEAQLSRSAAGAQGGLAGFSIKKIVP